MTVDPTDPETFTPDGPGPDPDPIGDETPEDDAAEQRADVRPDPEDADAPLTDIDPARASEGDAVEQARAVAQDDDDEYR